MGEWTDPDELAVQVGDLPRAPWANALLDNLAWLYNPPGCSVRLTDPQQVGSNSDALIQWDEAPWDTTDEGMWDDGTPGSIVIQREGRYLFHCSVLWEGNDDNLKRGIFLERDGQRIRGVQGLATDPAEQILTGITNLNEGALLEFVVRQNSGDPLDMRPGRTVATVQFVGPVAGPLDDPDNGS